MTSAQNPGLKQFLMPLLRWGKQSWWLTLAVWLVAMAPARAALDLRVAVEQGVSTVQVGSSTNALLKDSSGQVLAEVEGSTALDANAEAGGVAISRWRSDGIWIEPQGDGLVWIGDRWYRGKVYVVPTGSGLTAVNYVDLEEYLYSVLGGEMPTNWPLEALKAQAVAARSYALYQRQTGANTVFDVGDTTRWQVYGGVQEETNTTVAAVQGTRGQVLTYNGQIINAVFHSSSGGHTENVEDVWLSALPYLRAVPDYDQAAPVFQWTVTFSADQMRQKITGVGNIISFAAERSTPRGRLKSVRVVGDAGERVLTGDEMRQALNLRSTLFTIQPQSDRVASAQGIPTPGGFQVIGRGFGHGIGMSQYGAYGMASQGRNYRDIVLHYYQGAILSQIRVQ